MGKFDNKFHYGPVNVVCNDAEKAVIRDVLDDPQSLRDELKTFSETRCKHIHVRSNAASMRHTVSAKVFNPYLSKLTGQQ